MPTLNQVALITKPAGVDLSGDVVTTTPTPTHGGTSAEQNVYTYTADVSGAVIVFVETDLVEWDASGNIVYQYVLIDGNTGPFGNEIDVMVSQINTIYNPPNDDTLVTDITNLVNAIQCADVQGMGTLSDYTNLLALAQKVNDSPELADPANITKLEDLAAAAEAYGKVFKTISDTLEVTTEISAYDVLTKIKAALTKISGMFDNLGALKLSITRTAEVKIPDSITAVATQLDGVYSELDCALEYLDYFCTGTNAPANSALNAQDTAAIAAATGALNFWNNLSGSTIGNNSSQVAALNTSLGKFDSTFKKKFTDAATCLNDKFKALKTTYSTLSGNN